VAYFNVLAALVALLALLKLPKAAAWYLAKERRKRLREELPLFVSSLKWMAEVYPLQKALCSTKFGEISKVFGEFCDRYSKGESFESALNSCAVFPELEDLAKRLLIIYNTGSGLHLLDLYSDKISAENLSMIKRSAARMQIFAIAYTALVAVLPAMYSGLTIYTPTGNILPLTLLGGASLVVTWKTID
jgi:Flp pilus assembly protein TadB